MAGRLGLAFPHQLNDLKPDAVIVTTGESDDSGLIQQARALGVAAVVKKPWTPQALRAVVQKVIGSPTG